MIPIKLTLKNFMSYGEEETTLPFEGLHVACLSGDNGNGKSALLDAMTWALWGKTRASAVKSVSEDDLIRVGASEAEVRFEFELNEQRYRVVRKRKRGKSGGSEWQLTQADANGVFVPIGGHSRRETGHQIVQVLSMEYDTFVNSAYLQQGRADEFTRQTPDNRKRILGEILGLDRYDRLETKAKERFKERKEFADDLEREIRLLDGQIAELPEHSARLEAIRADLQTAEGQVAQQQKQAAEISDRRSKLDGLANTLADAEAQLRRMEADLAQREKERCDKAARLDSLRKILAQRESVLNDYNLLQQNRRRREQLEPEIDAFNKANSQLQVVIGAIEIEETKLQGDLRLREQELNAAEQKAQELARLEPQIAQLNTELQDEGNIAAALAQAVAAQEQLQQEFSDLSARSRQLETEICDLDEVLELLQRPQAACPVCESDLSGAKRETVLARQRQKRESLLAQKESVRKEGVAKKKALGTAQESVQNVHRAQHELTAKRSRRAELVARRDALSASKTEAKTLQEQVRTLRKQLEQGDYAGPKRVQRQRLESELTRLGLVKAEFEATVQRIRTLEPTEQRYQQLQQAEGSWEQEVAEGKRLEEVTASRRKELEAEHTKLDGLRAKLSQYEEVKRQAAVAEAELTRLRTEANRLSVDAARYADYIARCERAVEERTARQQKYKKADEERKMYQALMAAFGKKGVQALIIENAIPELEEEANELLARMTDNAMQVRFETTRAARAGNSEIETLDIKVMDDAGVRPYELFSGGEGFRINFAVRIALSRLLARRSGARLQTLIMDEGFGSQDGKGREKLLEVIEAIKEDFEKILVITHFEEMKDAFAQRIEIVKGPNGSRIHLL